MLFLFGKIPFQTFESYKEIACERLASRLENPYAIAQLKGGSYFFPWPDERWIFALWCAIIAAMMLWLYFRVNETNLYRNLGVSFGVLSLTSVIFFGSAFPHPGGVFIAFVCIASILINLTCVLAAAFVYKLPYFGVPEDQLSDSATGQVKIIPFCTAAFIIVVLPYFFSGDIYFYVKQLFGGNVFILGLVFVSLFSLAVAWGRIIMPLEDIERPVLGGESKIKFVRSIFTHDGPSTRTEVIGVGLALCVIYGIVMLLFKGSISGTDIMGLVVIIALAVGIVHGEMLKAAKNQKPEAMVTKKSVWGKQ